MSVKKELNKSTSFSYIDIFSIVFPDVKTKYYELFLSLIKNKINSLPSEEVYMVYQTFTSKAKTIEELEKIKKIPVENIYAMWCIYNLISYDFDLDIEVLTKFIDYNEKKLIDKNDLTTYKTYKEIENQCSLASIKIIDKELENQTYKFYEDDEWLLVRPLTSSSSVKYGYGTKWCTAMETDPSYFSRYSYKGILLYCLNKKTGYKVAVNRPFDENRTDFWNSSDENIDSIQTDLPYEILMLVKKELTENRFSNFDLLLKKCGNDSVLIKDFEEYIKPKFELKRSVVENEPENVYRR